MTVELKSYRQWLWENSPAWLKGPVASKLVGAIGLMADTLAETMVEALFARYLYTTDLPEDTLRRFGSERLMPRYGNESVASYKARLKQAWERWSFAGTRQAVLEQLTAAGYTCELWENYQWNWDGDVDDWSRFWVVILDSEVDYTQHYWTEPDLFWGEEGFSYGTSLPPSEIQAIVRLIRQWKAGHTRCEFIIVPFDMAAWSANPPNGTWDDPVNRVASAVYIPG